MRQRVMTIVEDLRDMDVNVSPDESYIDGCEYTYDESDAFAFVYDFDTKRIYSCGFGCTHRQIWENSSFLQRKYAYDKFQSVDNQPSSLAQGRLWLECKLMSFWGRIIDYKQDLKNIIDLLSQKLSIQFDNEWLINDATCGEYSVELLSDVLNDTSNDYCDAEDNLEYQQKLKNLHLMKGDEKKEYLNGYLNNRSNNIGKKLRYGDSEDEMPMAQWRALHTTSESRTPIKKIYVNEGQLALIRNILNENMEIEIEPKEIKLDAYKPKQNLNQHIWEGDVINSKLRLKLLDIADDFINYLNVKWVKQEDIFLVGSICDYCWSLYSDIDMHIMYDYKAVDERVEFVRDYFNTKKNEWNREHENLEAYGMPIELYVQDINDEMEYSGIYSLEKNEWVKKPNKYDIEDNDAESKDIIKRLSAKLINRIDSFYERFEDCYDEHELDELSDKVTKLLGQLKLYRTKSLQDGGQMSIGNIVYKVLRKMDYLDDLWKLKNDIYDRKNSLG